MDSQYTEEDANGLATAMSITGLTLGDVYIAARLDDWLEPGARASANPRTSFRLNLHAQLYVQQRMSHSGLSDHRVIAVTSYRYSYWNPTSRLSCSTTVHRSDRMLAAVAVAADHTARRMTHHTEVD